MDPTNQSPPKRKGNPNWIKADPSRGIKGRSGNPRGRPGNDVAMLAREHGEEAMARLVYWMRQCDQPNASIQACKVILDRAYGKAKEYHHMEGDTRVGLGAEERARIIDAICSSRSTSASGSNSTWVVPKVTKQ